MRQVAMVCTVGVLLGACTRSVPEETASTAHLVFGDDDRQDAYQISDPGILGAMDAVAALVPETRLTQTATGWSAANNRTHADRDQLCPGEAFADQLTVGVCSGVLVEPDLIATAGHCISDCTDDFWVFDFAMQDATTARTELDADDVYECIDVVDIRYTIRDDWALVRLDRPVVGRTPAPVRFAGTIPDDATLAMIGHPAGLPVKVVTDIPMVGNLARQFFSAAADVWRGSSGSAIFNTDTWVVEGIAARMPIEEYVWNGNCNTTAVCPAEGCPSGTEYTRVTQLSDQLTGAPACIDDAAEPDDLQSHATPTIAGLIEGRVACADDPDWYELSTVAGQDLEIQASFLHAQGDVNLAVYDDQGLLARADSQTDDEHLSITAMGDVLYVEVTGQDNTYDLQIAQGIDLQGTTELSPSTWITYEVTGLENGQRTQLWVGGWRGRSSIGGCTAPLDVGNGLRLDTQVADAAGRVLFTVQTPALLPSGGRWHLQAVTRDTCERSAPLVLTTP